MRIEVFCSLFVATFCTVEINALQDIYEGDIKMSSFQRIKRNAIRVSMWKWEDNIIPYMIETSGISDFGQKVLRAAIDEYNTVQSCVKWTPRIDQDDYVVFKDGIGCYSSIGRDGGAQELVLGSSCYYKGVIMHEMNHAVGFFHEQSRYDRDAYIQVNWENIQPGKSRDFTKQQMNIMDVLGTPYDYGSIMHYGPKIFTKNGKPTLVAKFDPHGTMGQRNGFSELDVWKIRKLYGCENGNPPLPEWMIWGQTTEAPPSSIQTTKTSSITTPTTMEMSTTKKPCEEEKLLPKGIPGKVQDFQVVLIENTLRVFWNPPCTSVPLTGYVLTIKNSQQLSTITIHPTRHTHYIYTANHPGSRYEMSIAAVSHSGQGQFSPTISTYAACGYDIVLPLDGSINAIQSPYFKDEKYEPEVACNWNIEAASGQRLKIRFDALNLDGGTGCSRDYLMINSDRYCDTVPQSGHIKSEGQKAKIVFVSQQSTHLKQGGFSLSIDTFDNHPKEPNVINKPGVIGLSWQTPEHVENVTFKYVFKYRLIPETRQEVVNLDSKIHQFTLPTGRHIGRKYEICLSTMEGSKEGRELSFTLRSACGHNISVASPGRIQNPPTFGSYEQDVVCQWTLKPAKPGGRFVLSFTYLDLEPTTDCLNDYVLIGSSRYCSNNQMKNATTIYNREVQVTFRSNGFEERKGFLLTYSVV